MNEVTATVPQKKSPRGNSASADTTTPSVPTRVTVSGPTPRRRRNCAVGVSTRVKNARA
jgi:hypothetical protein